MQPDRAALDAAFERSKQAVDPEGQRAALDDLYLTMEASLEATGRFEAEWKEFISESTNDVRSWRAHRRGAAIVALIVMVVVMVIFLTAMFLPATYVTFGSIVDEKVRITFIAATLGMIFGLTALLLRGAFSAARKDDGPAGMPEALKTMMETITTISGGPR